jgi:hypothetical protein
MFSGGYNFSETGALIFTGQASLFSSFNTGVIFTGNGTNGQLVITEPNISTCFDYNKQSYLAASNQTREKTFRVYLAIFN